MSKPWGRLCQIFVPFSEKLNFNSNFVSIWMSHWCRRATEGAEFRNTCKWLAFLSSFSHLQVIQNKCPWCSASAYVTAGLFISWNQASKQTNKLILTMNIIFVSLKSAKRVLLTSSGSFCNTALRIRDEGLL